MKKISPQFILLSALTGCLLNLCMANIASAQSSSSVPMLTRTVQMFSGLENNWLDAVQKHDTDTIKNLLVDNFEIRSAAAPDRPTPKEQAINSALKAPAFSSHIEQMAAHEYGTVVVVSFLWKLDIDKSSPLAQKIFVVDTWKQVDGNWQVSARYVSAADNKGKVIPGVDAPQIDTKKKI